MSSTKNCTNCIENVLHNLSLNESSTSSSTSRHYNTYSSSATSTTSSTKTESTYFLFSNSNNAISENNLSENEIEFLTYLRNHQLTKSFLMFSPSNFKQLKHNPRYLHSENSIGYSNFLIKKRKFNIKPELFLSLPKSFKMLLDMENENNKEIMRNHKNFSIINNDQKNRTVFNKINYFSSVNNQISSSEINSLSSSLSSSPLFWLETLLKNYKIIDKNKKTSDIRNKLKNSRKIRSSNRKIGSKNIQQNGESHQNVHNSLEEQEISMLSSSDERIQEFEASLQPSPQYTTVTESLYTLDNYPDGTQQPSNVSLEKMLAAATQTTTISSTTPLKKNSTIIKNNIIISISPPLSTNYKPAPVTSPAPPPPTFPTNQFNHKHQVNINNEKRPTIIIYPTVSPESIVIPIVSCILGFPILALMVICCLRRRAKIARERDRRRHYDVEGHAVSLVRFSPIHRLNNRSPRVVSLCSERSLSRGFPSLELDTVVEERSSDHENTQTDIISPESPSDVVNPPRNFQTSKNS